MSAPPHLLEAPAGGDVLVRSRQLAAETRTASALLAQIEGRAESLRVHFEELESARTAMSSSQRAATRRAARDEAAMALDELERLAVSASLTMALAELCNAEVGRGC